MSNAASAPESELDNSVTVPDRSAGEPVLVEPPERGEPDAVTPAISTAHDLERSGDRSGAREILLSQLRERPGDNQLRRELAWIDWADPDKKDEAVEAMRQILAESPDDTDNVVDYAAMLRFEGDRFTELQTLRQGLRQQSLDHARVRDELHSLYRELGWKFCLRVSMRGGETRWRDRVKALRSRIYWSTGGPLWFVTSHYVQIEEEAERTWTAWRRNLAQLDRIEELRSDVRARTSHSVDGYICRWALIACRANSSTSVVHSRLFIILLALMAAVAWSFVLTVAGAPLVPSILLSVGISTLALSAMAVIEWVCRRLSRLRLGYFASGLAFWVATAAILVALYSAHAYSPALRWQFVAFAALLTVAAIGPVVYAATSLPGLLFTLRINDLRRRHVRAGIIDSLLDALRWNEEYVQHPHNDDRAYVVSSIMGAADQIEKHLPEFFGATEELTRRWIRERAFGAATALRRLARDVIVARAGDDDRIVGYLKQEIVAVATSRFGGLRWSPPPGILRKSRGKQVLDTVRSLALMALPAVFFFGFSPFLGLPEDVLTWGKIVSSVWFILLAAIALDPALKEKLDLAKDLASTIRESKPQ